MDEFDLRVAEALNTVSGIKDPLAWLTDVVGGSKSAAGVRVNLKSALGSPAMYNGVCRIAGHMAWLPVQIRRKVGQSYQTIDGHPIERLFSHSANENMTAYTFREALFIHAIVAGNGRAAIFRDGNDVPTELFLLNPWDTYTAMVDGAKYHVTYIDPHLLEPTFQGFDTENPRGASFTIPDRDVFHIHGLSTNGYWGFSLTETAKDVLGNELSGIQQTGKGFANGGRPGIILEANRNMTPEQADEQIDNWDKHHAGVDNAHRTALLYNGVTAKVLPSSAVDSQFIESRQFSREDVALLLGVEFFEQASSYKGLTEKNTAYIQNTLNKWIEKLTQEIDRKLLSGRERRSGIIHAHVDATQLMKGDPNSLADYTGKLRTQGIMNGDEARMCHGMNPAGLTEYGNPNITTQEDSEEESPETTAVENQLRALAKYEIRRVRDAAKTQRNYLTWLEGFYAKFADKLTTECRGMGIDAEWVAEYVTESQDQILATMGTVTQEELYGAICKLTQNWEERCLPSPTN